MVTLDHKREARRPCCSPALILIVACMGSLTFGILYGERDLMGCRRQQVQYRHTGQGATVASGHTALRRCGQLYSCLIYSPYCLDPP